jgi:hypothetical protein
MTEDEFFAAGAVDSLVARRLEARAWLRRRASALLVVLLSVLRATMPPVQILVTGDVRGKLGRLFKRVETVNQKNGPFAAVFCVGEFFPSEEEKDAPGVDIAKYITGEATAPVPTYFLGGEDRDGLLAVMSDQSELCENITYLGKHGVATLHGLRIGFLSGLFADDDSEDDSLKAADNAEAKRKIVTQLALTTSAPEFCGIDALFSNQWPRGITAATNPGPASRPAKPSGTVAVAAAMLRPRYHFAGSEAMAWARTPYRSQAALHVTRFVALGPVIMQKGEKFLHALKLSPMAEMSKAELEAAPPACTRDPFASISAGLLPTTGTKRPLPGVAGGPGGKRFAGGGGAGGGGAGGGAPGDPQRIYVNNLSYQATEEQIQQFFGAIGPVLQVSIAKSQDDGRPRGFAHVSFGSAEEANRAILELNDAEFLGRKVGVRPATSRQAGAGGGNARSGWYVSGPPNQQEGGSINSCWFCLANPKADLQLVVSRLLNLPSWPPCPVCLSAWLAGLPACPPACLASRAGCLTTPMSVPVPPLRVYAGRHRYDLLHSTRQGRPLLGPLPTRPHHSDRSPQL